MTETSCEELPILTREEFRRAFRVNEATIDCWIREGRLEQHRAQGGEGSSVVGIFDDDLVRRLGAGDGNEELATRLGAAVRRELSGLLRKQRQDRLAERSGTVPRVELRSSRRCKRILRGRKARPEMLRFENRTLRIGGRRKVTRLQRTKASKTGAGTTLSRRRKVAGVEADQLDTMVEMLFPQERTKRRRHRKPKAPRLPALEAVAEASSDPVLAEQLWGDELLELVGDAGGELARAVEETVAEEVQAEHEVDEGLATVPDPEPTPEVEAESAVEASTEGDSEGDPGSRWSAEEILEQTTDVVAVETAADEVVSEDPSGPDPEEEVPEVELTPPSGEDRLPLEAAWDLFGDLGEAEDFSDCVSPDYVPERAQIEDAVPAVVDDEPANGGEEAEVFVDAAETQESQMLEAETEDLAIEETSEEAVAADPEAEDPDLSAADVLEAESSAELEAESEPEQTPAGEEQDSAVEAPMDADEEASDTEEESGDVELAEADADANSAAMDEPEAETEATEEPVAEASEPEPERVERADRGELHSEEELELLLTGTPSAANLASVESSLNALRHEVHEGHSRSDALCGSIDRVAASVLQLGDRIGQVLRGWSPAGGARSSTGEQGTLIVGFAMLVVTWAIAFYLKTGDMKMTLISLFFVNVVACAGILYSRTGKPY